MVLRSTVNRKCVGSIPTRAVLNLSFTMNLLISTMHGFSHHVL